MEVVKTEEKVLIQVKFDQLTPKQKQELKNILGISRNTYYKYRSNPELIRICDSKKIQSYFHKVFGKKYSFNELFNPIV